MNQKLPAADAPQQLLHWMHGLSDPARLRALRLLEGQALGVAELCDVLQMPQSTVSRHLKHLVNGGWIHGRREGTSTLYRMEEPLEGAARDLWEVARAQIEGWSALAQDDIRLARVIAARAPDADGFFAGAAERWDRMRQELYGAGFTGEALLALVPRAWTVLDLGCGTGAMVAQLGGQVQRVIGVDRSEAMLEAARARCAHLPSVDLRQGTLEALPVEEGVADAALMVLVLTYLERPEAALAEMARALKPGGQAVVVDLLRHDREDFRRRVGQRSRGFEPADLITLLESAGLESAQVRPLAPEAGATGPALLLATAFKRGNP